MRNVFFVFAMLFTLSAFGQNVVHTMEKDDFTGNTIIRLQSQKKGDYKYGAGTAHFGGDLSPKLVFIQTAGEDNATYLYLNGKLHDSYGGAHRSKAIFKFADGTIVSTVVADSDYEYKYSKYGAKYSHEIVFSLSTMFTPDAEVAPDNILLENLKGNNLEAVRIYFREGYMDFTLDDQAIIGRMLGELKAIQGES